MKLLKIEEIFLVDKTGEIIWKENNLDNILHASGEEFILKVAFNTANGSPPSFYYLGLDSRTTPSLNDTLSSLSNEPTQNGYGRQPVSSANGFSVALRDSNYRATSGTVSFTATGGFWGPVKNIFLATSDNNSGYLISTVALSGSRTVTDGQSLSMRISLGLSN